MHSFYGDLSGSLPCVICDASLRMIFANHSAYDFPVTFKWIKGGCVALSKRQREEMGARFESEPYSIAVIHCRDKTGRYTLLADRLFAHGTFLYVFAVSENEGLVSEFDGRRMLTACFTPRCGNEYASAVSHGALINHWYEKVSKAATPQNCRFYCALDPNEIITLKSEPLVCCLTALYGAFCDARGEFTVEAAPVKGGMTVSFSADTEEYPFLTSSGDLSAFLTRFPYRTAQVLFAAHIADAAGFSLTTYCGTRTVTAQLTVPIYDAGELGFKAVDGIGVNTENCLNASLELWF